MPDSIGTWSMCFLAITHMAPAVGIVATLTRATNFVGGSLPLSVLFALAASVLAAVSVGQIARHLPSAGGVATYAARGLHPAIGLVLGWIYALAELLTVPLFCLVLGDAIANLAADKLSLPYEPTWAFVAVLGVGAVFVSSLLGLRFSARAGAFLGAFQLATCAGLGLWLLARSTDPITAAVLNPKFAQVRDFSGIRGVAAGAVLVLVAFRGFEGVACLAEEARDPRRAVPRSVVLSVVVVGCLYLLNAWAISAFYGPSRLDGFAQIADGRPWELLARTLWGKGWLLFVLSVWASALAASSAAALVATRTLFALGRIGALPTFLGATNRRGAPHRAAVTQFLVGMAAVIILGFSVGPVAAYGVLAVFVVAVLSAVYAAVCLACTRFYLKEPTVKFRLVRHGLIPLLAAAAFILLLLATLGVGGSSPPFGQRLPYPLSLAGAALAISLITGVVLVFRVTRRSRRGLDALSRAHGEHAELPADD